MKKYLKILSAVGLCFGVYLNAATSNNSVVKNLKSTSSSLTSNFASGSVVSGSTYGGKNATNSVRRWYMFYEGAVGGSYTTLGKSDYWGVNLGVHAYIETIETAFLGLKFKGGLELGFPLYIKPGGKSNIIEYQQNNIAGYPAGTRPNLESKESEGLAGWGFELPVMLGVEKNGFYVVGLVGYGWLFMKDTYSATGRGPNPTIQTNYDGFIYGAGLGYKVSNIMNIGFRYMAGNMVNRADSTVFDDAAKNNSLDLNSITYISGKSTYDINYQKFMLFVAVVF